MTDPERAREAARPKVGRPLMPAGYGVDPEGTAGLLDWEDVTQSLAASRNYWVVTASPTARPHAAPVWGLWQEGEFCFSTDPVSRKGRNLSANPELIVHLESGDDVVVLEGRAEPMTEPAWLSRFADAYEAKYAIRPEVGGQPDGFYRLRPRVVLAWRERDFLTSATRWQF